jgi:hypothetical protein
VHTDNGSDGPLANYLAGFDPNMRILQRDISSSQEILVDMPQRRDSFERRNQTAEKQGPYQPPQPIYSQQKSYNPEGMSGLPLSPVRQYDPSAVSQLYSNPLRPSQSPQKGYVDVPNTQSQPSMAFVQERENQALRDEIRVLNSRLSQLDNQQQAVKLRPSMRQQDPLSIYEQ